MARELTFRSRVGIAAPVPKKVTLSMAGKVSRPWAAQKGNSAYTGLGYIRIVRPFLHYYGALFATTVAAITISTPATTQEVVVDSIARVVPGERYEAFANQTWLFGSGYRKLWTDTLSVPTLDLQHTAGGLTAVCSPPTLLSSDIRFVAADSGRWNWSSLDKPFAARYLPPSLYQSVAGRLAQDVISSTHPGASAVAPPFYQALGIPYPDVTLVVLPNEDQITEFERRYASKPGWLGPDIVAGNPRVLGLASVKEIITTQELWHKTKHASDVVDQRAYLTARLLDILLGEAIVDFNRLRWGRTDDTEPTIWRPIPWDRGNAFSNYDGFSRWYLRFYFPALVRFEDSYPSIFGLTFQGNTVDRRYLTDLELSTWDSVVTSIQASITDSLIESAVAQMPVELVEANGAELIRVLKARRDHLPEAAEEFYRLLAGWVDIHVTSDRSVVEITRLSDARLAISIWRSNLAGRPRDSTPYYSRIFRSDETREVRLYLDGQRDSVAIRGEGKQEIKLRIVRDLEGDVVDPEESPETEIYPAQAGSQDLVATIISPRFGSHVRLHRTPKAISHSCTPEPPAAEPELKSPYRDWGSVWLPVPALGYVSGLGIYAGLGVSKTDYAFRSYPFKAQHALWGGYASSPNSFFAEYYSDVRDVVGPFGGYLGATASGVSNPEFYGLGNETTNTQPDSFYRIDQFQGIVTPLVTLNPQPFTQLAAGFYYRLSNTVTGQGNIIDALQPFGSGKVDDLGLAGWFRFDSYNNQIATPAGIQVNVTGQFGLADGESVFTRLSADVLGFKSTDALPGHPTLALRLGGQVNAGTYPFYAAAFLSGTDNLKGYAPNRFGGDGSIYLNSELRFFVTEITWPIIANFGVLGIADVGRVFLRGESSNRWHTGFGGGVWLGLFRTGQGLNLALVDGESLRLYISTGFILKKKRFR